MLPNQSLERPHAAIGAYSRIGTYSCRNGTGRADRPARGVRRRLRARCRLSRRGRARVALRPAPAGAGRAAKDALRQRAADQQHLRLLRAR